jgi:hypothetical protein
MKRLGLLLVAAFGLSVSAIAQNADDYRGGWRTDGGEPHTYEFSIRGDQVRGVYCTRCSDATTLAFVDGRFGPDGITFTVTHVNANGAAQYQDRGTARFEKPNLVVTGTSGAPGGGPFRRVVIKDPRGPDPLPVPVSRLPPGDGPVPPIGARGGGGAALPATPPQARGGVAPGQPQRGPAPGPTGAGPAGRGGYQQPGPWKQLQPSDVVGVWLGFGVGVNKQYFIIRRVGEKLRGMVCGRCDNPYTMAALDDFEIKGEIMTFNILHEDWGPGSLPSHNRATVRVSQNEMRLTTQMDNTAAPAQPPGPNAGTSLLGPIAIEATIGNQ